MPRKVTSDMRAATAMKLAATTTAIFLLEPPIIEPLGQRLAQRERGKLGVLPLRVEQRLALLAEQHLLHLPEEDGVRAVRQVLHHAAVERHQRVDQHRRAGGEARPVARLEARLAALRAAEAGGELPVLRAQHVDAERLALRHRGVGGGELVDAGEHRGRIRGRRAHRGRRHAVAVARVVAGDDVDGAGERAHARLELLRVHRLGVHGGILPSHARLARWSVSTRWVRTTPTSRWSSTAATTARIARARTTWSRTCATASASACATCSATGRSPATSARCAPPSSPSTRTRAPAASGTRTMR